MIGPDERAIRTAMIDAACRVFARQSEALRKRAASLETTLLDGRGRPVLVRAPEAVTMRGTASLWDECAAELKALECGR